LKKINFNYRNKLTPSVFVDR